MKVDLRECKTGDRLVSKHGVVLEYVSPLEDENDYDHLVKYPNGSGGTRIHSGHVFRNPGIRLFEDHDIVQVIPLSILGK